MGLDLELLGEARQARDRLVDLQHEAEQAQVAYQHTIRRLHARGGSMREIADALGLSYQRVHQVVDVSTGKGAVKPSAIPNSSCAFCGAAGSEVRMLIAGPRVFICDRCVTLADEVVAERGQRTNELTLLVALDLRNPKMRCSFCSKRRDRTDVMVHAPRRPGVGKYRKRDPGVRICVDCLELCHEILGEQLGGSRV
jgi:ClpX C4-type zinc finger protein